jgi:hypothetical protein
MVWFNETHVRQVMDTINAPEAKAREALQKTTSVELAINYILNNNNESGKGAGISQF